jgi:voltage-gated potassium channel
VETNPSLARFGRALAVLLVVFVLGTLAFELELRGGVLDAFYRAVMTTSLTGLDSTPKTHAAQVTTILLVLAGVAIFAYVGAVIVEMMARNVLGGALDERRRRKAIDQLRDQFIICGYGRVGRRVAAEFRRSGIPYVVLDYSTDAVAAAAELGELFVRGNGTADEDLARAGLGRARGLVAATDDDADNLYISLSARAARPDLLIVARGSDEEAMKKLRLAGADRVVMPYAIAGRAMASLVAKPQVAAFLDLEGSDTEPDFLFEQIEVPRGCAAAGRTIGELRVHDRTGAAIIAVQKHGGELETKPSKDLVLGPGDVLVGVGSTASIQALERMFGTVESVAG